MDIKYYIRPNYGFDEEDKHTVAYSVGVARFILQPGVKDNDTFTYFARHLKDIECDITNPDYIIRVKHILHNTPFIIIATHKDQDKEFGDRVVGYLHLKYISIPDDEAKKLDITLGAPDLNAGVDLGMIVDPEYHGKGIGKTLMQCAIENFKIMNEERESNFRIIWPDSDGKINKPLKDLRSIGIYNDPTIYLSVMKNNTPAINLYKNFNFEFTNENETDYFMERTVI